jgi:hypothetical protein
MTIIFENNEELYLEDGTTEDAEIWADTFNTEVKEIVR